MRTIATNIAYSIVDDSECAANSAPPGESPIGIRLVAGGEPTSAWRHPFGTLSLDSTSDGRTLTLRLPPGLGRRGSDFEQLEHAAATLQQLDSRYILPPKQIDRGPDRALTIRYRYERGESLAETLRRGPLTFERALGVLKAVCRGLGEAHGAGITHRALSPASVIVHPRKDGTDDVLITDFGLADIVANARAEDVSLMPTTPERVLGFGTPHSEDVYLLGCLAYWMITGSPAFDVSDQDELLRRHAIEDVPEIRSLAPELPDALATLVDRALAKDPDDRFGDLSQLGAELERIVGGVARRRTLVVVEPLTFSPVLPAAPVPTTVELPPSPKRALAKAMIVGGFGLGSIAISAALFFGAQGDPPPETAPPKAPRVSTPVVAAPAPEPSPEPGPESAPDTASPEVEGIELLLDEAGPLASDTPLDAGSPPVEATSDDASERSDPTRPDLDAMVTRAKTLRRAGNQGEAIAVYERVLARAPKHRHVLRELTRLAFDAGDYEGAVTYGKRAVRASPNAPKDRLALGDAYTKLGRAVDARKQYEAAAKLGDPTAKKRLERFL